MKYDYILSFDFGVLNMAYCLIKIDSLKILKWGTFSIKDSTHEGSCKKLADNLDKLDLLYIDDWESNNCPNIIILLEQQPRVNIKTITISGQLQMYYVLKKREIETNNNKLCKIDKIIGYHAKNKLKYYEFVEGDEPIELEHLKNGHYKNKQMAIKHCERIIKRQPQNENWISFFYSCKKKDDLSDTMTMILSYIKFVIKE